jgi:hypothetical protein
MKLSCSACSTIDEFVGILTNQLNDYYNFHFQKIPEIKLVTDSKFHKIIVNNGVWGFVARMNGVLKGKPYRRGDLMKASSYNSPAAIACGNVIEGCSYGVYDPFYLTR